MSSFYQSNFISESHDHVVSVVKGGWQVPLGSDSDAVSAGPGVVDLRLFGHIDALLGLLGTVLVDVLDLFATNTLLVEFRDAFSSGYPVAFFLFAVAFASGIRVSLKGGT